MLHFTSDIKMNIRFLLPLFLAASSVLSPAAEVVIAPQGAPGGARFSYPSSHALMIANSKYEKGWAPLPATIDEAQQVARALLAQGFELHGGGVHCDLTGAQMKSLMDEFFLVHGRVMSSSEDRLVVFYGGHGATVQGTAQRGFILGVDAPAAAEQGKAPGAPLKFADADAERAFSTATVSMTEVRKQAEDANARHVLFIFDSCFAGTVFRSRAAGDDPSKLTASTKAPVREFLTSGGAAEEVPGKSVFVPYFIRGLKGLADKNADGAITSGELAAYVAPLVKESENPTSVTLGPLPRPEFNEGQTVFLPSEPKPETTLVSLIRPSASIAIKPMPVMANQSLSIKSKPDALSFSLISPDNEVVRTGKTPATLRDIPSGDCQVSFSFKNNTSYFVKAKFGPDGDTSVDVDFQALDSVPSLLKQYDDQTSIIHAAAQVAQKFGPPILRDMGYLAVKNKNAKLRMILVRQKLESFVPTAKQVSEIDAQLKRGAGPPKSQPQEPGKSEAKEPSPRPPVPEDVRPLSLPEDGRAVEYTTKVQEDIKLYVALLEKAIAARVPLVKQSEATQKQFVDVMKELDLLARAGDKDAQLILTSYGIKVNDQKPAKK